jgi:hypothetical protein
MDRSATLLAGRRDPRHSLAGPRAQGRGWNQKAAPRPEFPEFPNGYTGFFRESWRNLRSSLAPSGVLVGGPSATSDAADVNFSHYGKRSQNGSRHFREGLSHSAAAHRIRDANFSQNFSHYAQRSQSDARHFRESMSLGFLRRCPALLRPARIRRCGCSHGPVGRLRVTKATHSKVDSTAAGLIHPDGPPGRGYNRLQFRPAGHATGNANLPIGEFRPGAPAPVRHEKASAQRASPARQPEGIP